LFVKVTLFALAVPAFTFPKLRLAGLAETVTDAATPVPLSVTPAGEFGALLVMLTLPAKFPAEAGANATLNVVLCPAAREEGVVSPVTLYPAPLTPIWLSVSEPVPVLVIVKFCVLVWPSTTLPKLNDVGDTLRPGCTPVPAREIVSGVLLASLMIVTVPVALPATVGVNVTARVALDDGFTTAGGVMPPALKPFPATLILVIFTGAFPVLFRTRFCEAWLPVPTLPGLRLEEFALSCPAALVEPVPLSATVIVGFVGSLLVMLKLPVDALAAVGR
jgi:hypothetical protein